MAPHDEVTHEIQRLRRLAAAVHMVIAPAEVTRDEVEQFAREARAPVGEDLVMFWLAGESFVLMTPHTGPRRFEATPFRYAKTFRTSFVAFYFVMYLLLSRTARRLITVSHFSAAELAGILHVPMDRFIVAGCAADALDKVTPARPVVAHLPPDVRSRRGETSVKVSAMTHVSPDVRVLGTARPLVVRWPTTGLPWASGPFPRRIRRGKGPIDPVTWLVARRERRASRTLGRRRSTVSLTARLKPRFNRRSAESGPSLERAGCYPASCTRS